MIDILELYDRAADILAEEDTVRDEWIGITVATSEEGCHASVNLKFRNGKFVATMRVRYGEGEPLVEYDARGDEPGEALAALRRSLPQLEYVGKLSDTL